jgi:membrane dipeptidase
VDHVAIGTDTAYTSRNAEAEYQKIPKRPPARKRWCGFWSPDDPLFDSQWQREEQMLSLAWTNWPMITVGLVQRGYSDEDIQKILGGNVLRVAKAVLEGRAT